jgi:excisionase family DNA binding protein
VIITKEIMSQSEMLMGNPFVVLFEKLERIEELLSKSENKELRNILADTQPNIPEKLSISELAKYLNCSKVTIHNYKKRKLFPYYGTGRLTFFKRSEVDAALCSQGSMNKRNS